MGIGIEIDNVEQFDRVLNRKGILTFGYDLIFFTRDGGMLCHNCAKNERESIVEAITEDINDGWLVNAADSNAAYDPGDYYCDHCNDPLSPYEASDDD